MKLITDLVEQNEFLKILFKSIPCGVIIVDEELRTRAMNNVLEQVVGDSSRMSLGRLGGEMLGCIHSKKLAMRSESVV